jgi:hypothetical protein
MKFFFSKKDQLDQLSTAIISIFWLFANLANRIQIKNEFEFELYKNIQEAEFNTF